MTRLLAFALILIFSVYFTWDIVRLRKALLHPDLYTTYYAFRHWFATRLADGQFPLWNPHWGIGQAADIWATIPLDLYTLLELAFGPRYHLFHALQALLVLTATLYAFSRLGVSPLLSAAGAIVFLLTPHITFFYFYFIVAHSYVAHVLLFALFVLWFKTGQPRYLFFITWTTIFSMFGTKLEFWFFQTVYFAFLAFAGSAILRGGRLYDIVRSASVPCVFMTLGVAAHAWQLNILGRLMTESGRAVNSGLAALASWELHRNLALSLIESVFLKLALLAGLLILALRVRPKRAYALVALAGILCALFLYQERMRFASDQALRNGSLESWVLASDGRTVPEYFSYDGSGDVRRATAPGETRSGSSAFIGVPATGEARLRYRLGDVAPYRGKGVRLTLWSRTEIPTPGAARVIIEDGHGPPSVLTLSVGREWVRSTLAHYVDAEARGLSISMELDSSAPAGVLIDDVELARSSGLVRSKASRDGTLLGLFAEFVSGPVLVGAVFGFVLSLGLAGRSSWRGYAAQTLLLCPFVYYYCRQAQGDLGEVHYVRLAPVLLQIALTAGVWLGCALLQRDPVARLAYASVCFVFLMRDQGQIILTYLSGWLWIPTRDNYILDFAFLLLALLGFQRLADQPATPDNRPRRRGAGLVEGLGPLTVVAALLLVTHSNLYYVHPLMGKPPDGFPYFDGVPSVRDLFRRLKEGRTSRAYLHNEPFMEFHHGAGSSLLEGFSQVTSYASLNSARYRDWTTYHRLGIRPEQHWRGYPNEYTPGTVARLPKANTLGYTNSQIYRDVLINRPPLDGNLLRLLGVDRVLHIRFSTSPYRIDDRVPPIQPDVLGRLQPSRVRGISTPDAATGTDPMFVADLAMPLPRAFVVSMVPPEHRVEFESELTPRWEAGLLRTALLRLSVAPAEITRYEPERVTVAVTSREEAILVLTDLYHPFWRAFIDGQPADLTPALFLFRGVSLPAGTHRVEFTCQVPAARSMLVLSLLSGLLSVTAFTLRRTHRESTQAVVRPTG